MLNSKALEGFYRVRVKEGDSDHYGSWNSIIREKNLTVSVFFYFVLFCFLVPQADKNSTPDYLQLCHTGFLLFILDPDR